MQKWEEDLIKKPVKLKYGSCSEQAIKLVTINPAKLLRINDRTGSLKVGKDADIVIWNNPPLSTYAKVEQTFVDGCLLFDANQQSKLVKANKAKRASLINEMIIAKKNGHPTRPIKLQKTKFTNAMILKFNKHIILPLFFLANLFGYCQDKIDSTNTLILGAFAHLEMEEVIENSTIGFKGGKLYWLKIIQIKRLNLSL